MSKAEMERFEAALAARPELAQAYGAAAGPAELAARLKADGFALTLQDLLETAGASLPDAALDQVSGGRGTPAVDFDALRARLEKWRESVDQRFGRGRHRSV